MSLLVAIQTVLIVLLGLLVAALMRSHAELIRRLESDPGFLNQPERMESILPRSGPSPRIKGATLDGDLIDLDVSREAPLLLAFLTSGCDLCESFWVEFADEDSSGLPEGLSVVVVAKDRKEESLSKLRRLSTPGLRVVLSSSAWQDYAVSLYPYFVYVDTSGEVVGEGAAQNARQIVSLLTDAIEERLGSQERTPALEQSSPSWRESHVDSELAAAGITPDHPSLYDNRWSETQLVVEASQETSGGG